MTSGVVSALSFRHLAAAVILGLSLDVKLVQAAPALLAPTEPTVWSDEAKGLVVITTRTRAAESKDGIQNQAAAFVEGLVNSGSVAPQSVRAITIRKLPALEVRGDLLSGPKGIKCVAILAFARNQTFIVHGMGPNDPDPALVESHCAADGAPQNDARPVLDDLAVKMKRELGELRRLALAVQKRQLEENRKR